MSLPRQLVSRWTILDNLSYTRWTCLSLTNSPASLSILPTYSNMLGISATSTRITATVSPSSILYFLTTADHADLEILNGMMTIVKESWIHTFTKDPEDFFSTKSQGMVQVIQNGYSSMFVMFLNRSFLVIILTCSPQYISYKRACSLSWEAQVNKGVRGETGISPPIGRTWRSS